MIVYKITNKVNGKIYIGITAYSLDSRMRRHFYDLRRGSTKAIHCAMRKYGVGNFIYEIIDQTECYDELNRMEIGYIKIYNSMSKKIGYNMTVGGGGCVGFKQSEEAKRNMSRIQKGRPRTEADRERTSRTFKGIPKSEEHRRKISEGNAGQPKSKEHRAKLSIALSGRPRPDLIGEKHGMSKVSDEMRCKIYAWYIFDKESQASIARRLGIPRWRVQVSVRIVRKWLPQNVVTRDAYEDYVSGLRPIDLESTEGIVSEIEDDCATGACPVR